MQAMAKGSTPPSEPRKPKKPSGPGNAPLRMQTDEQRKLGYGGDGGGAPNEPRPANCRHGTVMPRLTHRVLHRSAQTGVTAGTGGAGSLGGPTMG